MDYPILAYTPFNFGFVQGNTPSLTVQVTLEDGITPVDITNATIYLTCKADPSDDDPGLFQLSTTTGEIVILNQITAKGQYVVTFPAAATSGLSALLKYPYDSKVELPTTPVNKQTVIGGYIQLTQAITKA